MYIVSWLRFALLAACLASLSFPQSALRAQQDEMPADQKGNEKLYNALRDVINQGADLYNSGDRNGCYRLFQGALITVKAQVASNPELQKLIESGIAEAETQPSVGHRAFALRGVLNDVRNKIGPKGAVAEKPATEKPATEKPATEKPAAEKTLWARLGGEKAVTKVVDEFVDAAKDNPMINFDRGGKVEVNDEKLAALKKSLVTFVSQATGGPIKYAGKSMKDAHKGMGITNEEFDAAGALLRKILEDNKVDDEVIDAFIKVVDSTRKDIVEGKKVAEKPEPEDKKPEPKKPAAKVDPEDKKPEPKKPAAKVEPEEGGTGSVSGKVMVGGKALPEAEVYLIPKGNLEDKGFATLGEKDGSFEIQDVKSGEYVVVVKTDDEKAGVPKAYNDPKTSPITIKVKKGENKTNIDIKADGGDKEKEGGDKEKDKEKEKEDK